MYSRAPGQFSRGRAQRLVGAGVDDDAAIDAIMRLELAQRGQSAAQKAEAKKQLEVLFKKKLEIPF